MSFFSHAGQMARGWLTRRGKILGIGTIVAFAVLGIAYVLIPAPHAQGAVKGHTVEISPNAVFRVVFTQPMNQGSVESAFRLTPSTAGTFSWKKNELTFTPQALLSKGETYEVTVTEDARNLFYKKLDRPFVQTFKILDFPEAVVAVPADQSEVGQNQVLTVLFDHPMRRLSNKMAVPDVLKIEPAVKGVYHWLGTSGFEFVPEQGWPAASRITVTLPKGIVMADGGSTVEDKTWSFRTPPLSVYASGNNAPALLLDAPVVLTFNYPIKPEAIAVALEVREGVQGETFDKHIVVEKTAYTVTRVKDNPKAAEIRKRGKWSLGMEYRFRLAKGFTGDVGSDGLTDEFVSLMRTGERGFRVLRVCPSNNAELSRQGSVLYVVNNPVDEKTIEDAVVVSPAAKEVQTSAYGWSEDQSCNNADYKIAVQAIWRPSSAYTVTLKNGIKDIYGQPLEFQSRAVSFTTKPYEPSAELSSYSSYGMLAAHLPRVYQLRTMNVSSPVAIGLCEQDMDAYRREKSPCVPTWTRSYDPQGTLNTYKILDVDLDQVAGKPLPNGFYQLSVDIPQLRQPQTTYNRYDTTPRKLVITDTALTVKKDTQGMVLVWATDLKTGNVVSGLSVEAWGSIMKEQTWENRLLEKTMTDAKGLATFHLGQDEIATFAFVKATNKTRLGYVSLDWNDGISVWNYGLERTSDASAVQQVGYVYTDRALYRPDQKVLFKAVVRRDEDARLTVPDVREAEVVITGPEGEEVLRQTYALNAYGTVHGELVLQPSMKLGQYVITVSVALKKEGESPVAATGVFNVREYRRPDFRVEADVPEEAVFAGKPITIPLRAVYYHGVPLANATVTYEVTRTKLYFQPMQLDWYNFTLEENTCYWYCRAEGGYEVVTSGEINLGPDGKGEIAIPANLTDYKWSATYLVNITVADKNQRRVSTQVEFPVHKGAFYLGIRSNYDGGWGSQTAIFDVVSVNPDSTVRPNTAATISFFRRTWTNVKKETANNGSFWEYQPSDTLLEKKAVTTDAEGKTRVVFTPDKDGEYLARVETRDTFGNTIAASVTRYVYRGSDLGGSVRVTDDHLLTIVQNKASYEVGDTASLAVQTPYGSTKALITIERKTIRETRVIDLSSKQRTIEIPITDDMTPNIYVSVMTVKGGGETGIPEFRMGYANLQVNTTKKILDLHVTPDKQTYKPGDRVTLSVEAKKSDGSPAQAEVSLAVVDERVIALLGSIDKNILGKFWFPRGIGVDTAQTLTMLVKKVFFATEGGAGDGKGGGSEAPAVRGNFQDTAYWNATVTTGSDGKAQVTFNLPDNVTSWNILAIGTTEQTEVGTAEQIIVTRKDLMVEPALPRILRANDRATLGATVINATDKSVDAEVSIQTEGVSVENPGVRRVSLAPKGNASVVWKVRVPSNHASEAKFTVRAIGNGFQDGFEIKLPLLDYAVPEIVSASGIFTKNHTESLEIPEDALATAGQVDVSVQPNVGDGLQKGLDFLAYYPYGCTEQKTSGLLANIMFLQLVQQGVVRASPESLEKAKAAAQAAIRVLVATQHGDGGWSFWPDDNQPSYPWLSAHAFDGLIQARKAGFPVDEWAMNNAYAYLKSSMYQASEPWKDAERAQVVFTLSEYKTDDLGGLLATLYEHRDQLPAYARAYLAMAYRNVLPDASSLQASGLIAAMKNRVVYLNPSTAYVADSSGYTEYLNDDPMATALYMRALLKIDPNHEDVERVLRYLMEQRKDGYWATTYRSAHVLRAIVDYVALHPVDKKAFSVSVFLDNKMMQLLTFMQGDVSAAQTKSFSLPDLKKQGLIHQIGLEKDTDTRAFYDITMKVYREIEQIEPFENGMFVTSDLYRMDDAKREHPLTEVTQGETVRVRIKTVVPKDHRYVALEYHLPAGLEAIDSDLKTSPQGAGYGTDRCYPDWSGETQCMTEWEYGWWWENVWTHREIRDDRVFLFANALNPGVYEYEFLAQALTPGDYRIPPARVYEFYNPLANGHNEGRIFHVKAK